MTKGNPIEVIAVPHGEWARSICEDCSQSQWLTVDNSRLRVCATKRCRIFKAIMRRSKK